MTGSTAADAPLIGIVAGEASGDLLGASLVDAVRRRLPRARFLGIAGPAMEQAGVETLFPMHKLAVRGYVEVLRHYREITGIRQQLATRFTREPPALFIGVDAPDFNLALERRLKRHGVPTLHYVSPSIWAWRGWRMRGIRRAVSHMLTLFPFEQALYERAGIPVTYVGHPLADMLADFPARDAVRDQLRIARSAPVVAVLPGSRLSELQNMAGLFIDAALRIQEQVPDAVFLVPVVSRETREVFEAELYRRVSDPARFTILFGHAHEAMAAANIVLVASGTATLEAALLRRPMVIAYRMPRVSWWIMNNLRYQPWVGLPNILAGEFLVPEFLQDAATPHNVAQAAIHLLSDAGLSRRLDARFAVMAAGLRQGAAEKSADAVLAMLARGRA